MAIDLRPWATVTVGRSVGLEPRQEPRVGDRTTGAPTIACGIPPLECIQAGVNDVSSPSPYGGNQRSVRPTDTASFHCARPPRLSRGLAAQPVNRFYASSQLGRDLHPRARPRSVSSQVGTVLEPAWGCKRRFHLELAAHGALPRSGVRAV